MRRCFVRQTLASCAVQKVLEIAAGNASLAGARRWCDVVSTDCVQGPARGRHPGGARRIPRSSCGQEVIAPKAFMPPVDATTFLSVLPKTSPSNKDHWNDPRCQELPGHDSG